MVLLCLSFISGKIILYRPYKYPHQPSSISAITLKPLGKSHPLIQKTWHTQHLGNTLVWISNTHPSTASDMSIFYLTCVHKLQGWPVQTGISWTLLSFNICREIYWVLSCGRPVLSWVGKPMLNNFKVHASNELWWCSWVDYSILG